jgi:hypothetical protein
MITKLKPKINKETWHKVYFLMPTTIEVLGTKYRIYKDYVWRKRLYHFRVFWSEWGYYEWLYSLTEPPKECL